MKNMFNYFVLNAMLLLLFSCLTNQLENNYEKNLAFLHTIGNKRIEGSLTNDAIIHLEKIGVEGLMEPKIFRVIVLPPYFDQPHGSISVYWSEYRFNEYVLDVIIEDAVIATEKIGYLENDDVGQKQDFKFVYFYAIYPLSTECYNQMKAAYLAGKKVELRLSSLEESSSSPLYLCTLKNFPEMIR